MNVRNIRTPKGCEFDARRHVVASVSSRSVLQVDGVTCSVPEHLARTDVDVFAGPFAFDVVGRDGTSVTHLRAALARSASTIGTT